MKHAMLDIETMGTTPGCVIISVAMVAFNPETGELGNAMKCNIDLNDSLSKGFRIEGGTLRWWLEQRGDVLRNQLDSSLQVSTALDYIEKFLKLNGIEYLWGNSAAFDCGLLKNYFERAKRIVPWSHWLEMCYRTVRSLAGSQHCPPKDESQVHDPLYDCKYQIACLVSMLKTLNYERS